MPKINFIQKNKQMVGKMKIQKELGLHININKQAGKIQTLNQEKSDLIV